MLPKIRIASKKASNKSCLELNFIQKSPRAPLSILSRSGARRLERLASSKYLVNYIQFRASVIMITFSTWFRKRPLQRTLRFYSRIENLLNFDLLVSNAKSWALLHELFLSQLHKMSPPPFQNWLCPETILESEFEP